eukprot:Protomagalhaensia_wolfi_Nauph_80__3045@NODE_311_length_2820_cov_17_984538_g234_i0_p1_GENE_NODE_311_length_2820_cov_17_984538_g234_i0NODE_311_length_2820_cov_17_984538_g234_i0_p1_ORF_typecomplete_len436_score63_85_NODE_311_length_2820_cov_17_984538_g234_i012982605
MPMESCTEAALSTASLWMNYLTIPEAFTLRLLCKAFASYIWNELSLCDVTLTMPLLLQRDHPLNDPDHPLSRLLWRCGPVLRSFIYRPDTAEPKPVLRRLDSLAPNRCFAARFADPLDLRVFRCDTPLIPMDYLTKLLTQAQRTLRQLDVLVSPAPPGRYQDPGTKKKDGDGPPEFLLLKSFTLLVCPSRRRYEANSRSSVAQLFANAQVPLLRNAIISGQDPSLAKALASQGVNLTLYEPRIYHVAQIRELSRTMKGLGSAAPSEGWRVGEMRNLRAYYVLKMLQFLGAAPKVQLDKLLLIVGAEQLSPLIPHLIHVDRAAALGAASLRGVPPAAANGVHGVATPGSDEAISGEAGAGMMDLRSIWVLRDEESPAVFLGTVEQFAVDVVEIQHTGDRCSYSDRLQVWHDRVIELHGRHFLNETWIPHVFVNNIS